MEVLIIVALSSSRIVSNLATDPSRAHYQSDCKARRSRQVSRDRPFSGRDLEALNREAAGNYLLGSNHPQIVNSNWKILSY